MIMNYKYDICDTIVKVLHSYILLKVILFVQSVKVFNEYITPGSIRMMVIMTM